MKWQVSCACAAAVLALGASLAGASPGTKPGMAPVMRPMAADAAFQAAANEYRQGRTSVAYGRFIALANAGDADAVRIVLFMHRYGPALYGKYWDVGSDEIEDWTHQACGPNGRVPPPFKPAVPPKAGAAQTSPASR